MGEGAVSLVLMAAPHQSNDRPLVLYYGGELYHDFIICHSVIIIEI